jgi:hypothetical protein
MKERWADIMDDHDKKRPVVRPKVKPPEEHKTKNTDQPNGTVHVEGVSVPTRVCV